MKEVALSCLAVLASMVFFSLFWAPWVELITQSSADLAAVKGWIWLAGLIAFGAIIAYWTWPPLTAIKLTTKDHASD